MNEPKPLLAMSPGRKWTFRAVVLGFWSACISALVSLQLSDGYTPLQRGTFAVMIPVTAFFGLYMCWKAPRGVRLDPPDEFAPERYPPEQRHRARMTWGDCMFAWFLIGVGMVVALGSVVAAVEKVR